MHVFKLVGRYADFRQQNVPKRSWKLKCKLLDQILCSCCRHYLGASTRKARPAAIVLRDVVYNPNINLNLGWHYVGNQIANETKMSLCEKAFKRTAPIVFYVPLSTDADDVIFIRIR
jgi:hypothetical protein